MSEKHDNNNNVRRFSRRDQKDKLVKPSSLFPVDDDNEPIETFDFDIDNLYLPDTNSEALAMLSSLHDEVKAPVITPQADRYPPIAPAVSPQKKSVKQQSASQQKQSGSISYNFLTLLLVVCTILTIIWFGILWDNPQSALNPLPPATPFVIVTVLPNNAAVQDIDPSQPTPDADGQIFVVITDTPAPTAIGTESPFTFVTSPVLYAPNSNELGCNWWSIAGTVSDFDNNPISGYRISVTGNGIDETVFSGASQAFGAGGYELPLVGTPQEALFTVQLLTAQDVPLSDEISVTTRSDCDGNVTVINFIQNR